MCAALSGYCQPYGNEWIKYSNTYYRFDITDNGVYRITQQALGDAGLPVATINPETIKIFRNGQEIYIHIEGEGDNSFDPGDFIEFYATKNDGIPDAELYDDPAWQPNPQVSLFNDTAVYFLTWDNDVSNNRYFAVTDTDTTGKTPASFILAESRNDYTEEYSGGPFTSSNIYSAPYEIGEGWTSGSFTSPATFTLNFPEIYAGFDAPSARASISLLGTNNNTHIVNIVFAGKDTTVTGSAFYLYFLPFNLSASSLSPATQCTINPIGSSLSGLPDRNAVAYIAVKYPRTLNLGNASSARFFLPDGSQGKSYLIFSDFQPGGSSFIYDVTFNNRITVFQNGNTYWALVPDMGGEKECFLSGENSVRYVTGIKPAGNGGKFTDYAAEVINNNYIIITHTSLRNEADMYKNYRALSYDGLYNPVVIEVDELYDQFIYGIRKDGLAIRHFADFILDNWDIVPRALFLFGKSVAPDLCRKSPVNYAMNLVPTLGYPPADHLLSAGLTYGMVTTQYEPAIPTGRLAARTPEEAMFYYNKVTEYETVAQEPAEWMKKIIHFGGGKTSWEQETIKNILDSYDTIIADTSFGGFVYPFLKASSDPIQPEIATSAINLIDSGVSVITFIGHSSQYGFDVNLDLPGKYSNRDGKYPLVMAIGCLAGNIHDVEGSYSEQWILPAEGNGSIAFFASTSLGELNPLKDYLRIVYKTLGQTFYGSSIGKIIQEAIRASQVSYNTADYIHSYYDMAFHGDPAIVIHSPLLPDLSIKQQDVYYTPSYVTTDMNSFDINVVVTNLGRAVRKEFPVEVIPKLPLLPIPSNPVIKVHDKALFKDTVSITLPVDPVNSPGLNEFAISVNPGGSSIEESRWDNNSTTSFLFIRSNDIVPVYPPEFAIIPGNTVTLTASTGDPFAGLRNYIFQIDTNGTFIFPLASKTISQAGGVVQWTPPLVLSDSTVYFWRVRWDSSNVWRNSSFEYINSKYGWGQSHFNQFLKNDYMFIKPDSLLRKFDFVPAKRELFCRTIGNPSTLEEQTNSFYTIDLVDGEGTWCCEHPSIMIAVIDSLTLEPWKTPWGIYDSDHYFNQVNGAACSCGSWNRAENYFIFWSRPTDDQYRTYLAEMITNKIPDGNYVLIYSYKNANISFWKSDLLQAFSLLGADTNEIKSTSNDNPFIFLCRKGIAGFTPVLLRGNTDTATLELNQDLESNWRYGKITTPEIGPSNQWQSLHWRITSVEPSDKSVLSVTGITIQANKILIAGLDSIGPGTPDILNLNNFIDADSFPGMQLSLFLQDDLMKTPAHIRNWRILFEGVPEAALNPSLYHTFFDDTLQEGAQLQCATAVQNISYYNMDSMRVHWWINTANQATVGSTYKKLKPLAPADTLIARYTYNTMNIPGYNSLWIEINPKDSLWQREQTHFNNIAQIPFYVERDRTNPILDVTFDGIHILNGDIVSAEPDILFQLKDENKYLVLNDSNLFEVYIKYPGATTDVQVPYDGVTLVFTPASLPENKARVNFRPTFTDDGTYQLRVSGKDASNNRSGDMEYIISFQVITRPSVTYFLNWPNPFSTATHFVFTLTGSDVPDQIRIQIMTITGKVVREIFGWELGNLHIGRNITDFRWDGTDQWGDRLANGIYLYKVDIRLNGEFIEHRSTDADRYFHKGYGKMYLMR
ncbi:MAG: hypothetical protein HYY40_13590 [Bacteroidetes bacterium]|nr:hypothetical protein [Bacteroidota bacterium]